MTKTTPAFIRDVRIAGPQLVFRPATADDAEFILSLRLDEEKARHLSVTDPDVDRQRAWIAATATDPAQMYFLIEDHAGKRLGTVRLYGARGPAFCWGSWILSDERPPSAAVESTLMVYMYGLYCGFDRSYFEVLRDNLKVWRYHERMGAVRVGEDGDNLLYEIDPPAIAQALEKYRDRIDGRLEMTLPDGRAERVTIDALVAHLRQDGGTATAPTLRPTVATESIVPGVTLLNLRVAQDQRGKLAVAQDGDGLPFVPQRLFMVYDVPSRESRGEHAHHACHQLLICVRGEVTAIADDGRVSQEFMLDTPERALYMPPRIWGTQYRYSSDALLLVLASHAYDPEDYIRDYRDFLALVQGGAR